MADEETKATPKAKLDGDDILPEPDAVADAEKVRIDLDKMPFLEDADDKVALDIEGALDEEIPKELEVPRQAESPAQKPEKPVESKAPQRLRIDITRLQKLPLLKIAAFGGTVLACVIAGFLTLNLLLQSEPVEQKKGETPADLSYEESADNESGTEGLTLDLEPFVVPVAGGAKGFLRLTVQIRALHDAPDAMHQETLRLRTTIYNLLLHSDVEALMDDARRKAIGQELKKLLNTLLRKEYILDVRLNNVLLVSLSFQGVIV